MSGNRESRLDAQILRQDIGTPMTQPILSIIVTAYNQEDTLSRCLHSILYSDLKEYEIAIVDDSSTDQTPIICEEFSRQYSQIRTKRLSRNYGPGAARNAGAEYARGRFLYFVDGDDAVVSSTMGQLLNVLQDNLTADVVAVNHVVATSCSRKARSPISEEGLFSSEVFLSRHYFMLATPLWQFIYKRSFF